MSTYNYVGMTTYILEQDYTKESLCVLAEAIHTLQGVDNTAVELSDFDFVLDTDAFKDLYRDTTALTPHTLSLPQDTPAEYAVPSITHVNVKGYDMVRIFIPTTAEDDAECYRYLLTNGLAVLDMLFGDDIVSVKTRACDEYHSFSDAVETVLKPVATIETTNESNVA